MILTQVKLLSIPALALILGALWTLEAIIPLFTLPENRSRHAVRNLTISCASLAVNTVLGFIVIKTLAFSEKQELGILHLMAVPFWLKVIFGFLLIDLFSYGWHVVAHHVPFLWRFHQVHHTDTFLDVSSSFRNHPLEGVFQIAFQALVFPLLGVPYLAFFLFYLVSSPWILLVHANVRLPSRLDSTLRVVVVTPNWHKVHHSADIRETNSHYGVLFSFWDRLFGTAPKVNVKHIQYGLEYFRKDKFQKVGALLLMPFKKTGAG